MYILASNFLIDYKYYLKIEIRVVCREFFAYKYYLSINYMYYVYKYTKPRS